MANLLEQAQKIMQSLEERQLSPKDVRESGLAVNLALLGLAASAIKRIQSMIDYIQKTESRLLDDSRVSQLNTRELLEVYTTLQDYHAKQIEYLQQVSKLDIAKIEALLTEKEIHTNERQQLDPSLVADLIKKAYPTRQPPPTESGACEE